MWLVPSAFHHHILSSTAAWLSSTSTSTILSPRGLGRKSFISAVASPQASSLLRLVGRRHHRLLQTAVGPEGVDSSIRDSGGGGGCGGGMVPEDAVSLLRAVYGAESSPQVCVSTTGSGGQAVSWLLGVPGASSCLLEATIPYSMAAFDEKIAAGPSAPGYVSREAAEGLARNAYARAVALSVAESNHGPHALPNKTVIGVGCTAAVASSRPKRGLHRCFVCAQTAGGLAHYELVLAKGRRDRDGEDKAVSRVLLQAIAEAAGVPVPNSFKTDHLFLNADTEQGSTKSGSDAGGVTTPLQPKQAVHGSNSGVKTAEKEELATETAPEADIVPEPDPIQELIDGRLNAVLIVPMDTRSSRNVPDAPDAPDRSDDIAGGGGGGDVTLEKNIIETRSRPRHPRAVVLRDATIRGALPRGATVILPGSYNPLHRGHIGLMEAARRALLSSSEDDDDAPWESRSGSVSASVLVSKSGGKSGRIGLGERKISMEGAEVGYGGGSGLKMLQEDGGVDGIHAVFEVSMANPDKGGLEVEEIKRRTRQFSEEGGVGWPYPVVITRAPLFSQKARLFPGCAFVVGADTASRIVDPKYYQNSQVEMVAALAEILHLGCSFIVGGRQDTATGRFVTLEDVLGEAVDLPKSVRSMFHGLDESRFREDLSSTSIRKGTADPGLRMK